MGNEKDGKKQISSKATCDVNVSSGHLNHLNRRPCISFPDRAPQTPLTRALDSAGLSRGSQTRLQGAKNTNQYPDHVASRYSSQHQTDGKHLARQAG